MLRTLVLTSLVAVAACGDKQEPQPAAAAAPITGGKVTRLDQALEQANPAAAPPAARPPVGSAPAGPMANGVPVAQLVSDWADVMKPMLTDVLMNALVHALEKGLSPTTLQLEHAQDFAAGKLDELNKLAAEHGFADFATWSGVFTRVVQASGRMVVEKLGQKATDMLNDGDYQLVMKYWNQLKDEITKAPR